MKSMTGYGRGACEVGGRRLVVELRSVNHRFLEIKLRLPWPDAALEAQIVQRLRGRLERGVITVGVRDEGGGTAQTVRVDLELARQYAAALSQLRAALGSEHEPLSLQQIAEQPGVLTVGEPMLDPEALWRALEPGVDDAVTALIDSRAREGQALAADLLARLGTIEALTAQIGELVREAPDTLRKRLRERLERAVKPGEVDPQRLAQEVAILADKLDVTEELTRLAAHLAEAKRLCAEQAATGRRLDFLVQEMNREVNTVGSKSQSAQVAARVVDAKAELERLREQIQNVE
jgi:uncharacterized protein (TIGR00255 family)